MKKFWLSLMAVVIISVSGSGFIVDAEPVNTDIKLTEKQKQEMAELHQRVLKQKKEIINKYVEYGVFTEEKAKKIITKLEKRYEKLEENGFIPKWDEKHKKPRKPNPRNW